MNEYKKIAIIVAGGSGKRMKSVVPKQFMILNNIPVLMHTLLAWQNQCDSIILALPPSHVQTWNELCKQYTFNVKHTVCEGGNTRYHSVYNALKQVDDQSLVAIHDGVRPCISSTVIKNAFDMALTNGNAVVAVPSKDSIRKIHTDGTSVAVNRTEYYLVQTPQVFRSGEIKISYENMLQHAAEFTDDASVMEATGTRIQLCEGDYRNIKITTPEDLAIAEQFVATLNK